MYPELGTVLFALILALLLAGVVWVVVPLVGSVTAADSLARRFCRPLTAGIVWYLSLGFGILLRFYDSEILGCLMSQQQQQSVALVLQVSAVWGGHEGSLLLWILDAGGAGPWRLRCFRSGLPFGDGVPGAVVLASVCVVFCCCLSLFIQIRLSECWPNFPQTAPGPETRFVAGFWAEYSPNLCW